MGFNSRGIKIYEPKKTCYQWVNPNNPSAGIRAFGKRMKIGGYAGDGPEIYSDMNRFFIPGSGMNMGMPRIAPEKKHVWKKPVLKQWTGLWPWEEKIMKREDRQHYVKVSGHEYKYRLGIMPREKDTRREKLAMIKHAQTVNANFENYARSLKNAVESLLWKKKITPAEIRKDPEKIAAVYQMSRQFKRLGKEKQEAVGVFLESPVFLKICNQARIDYLTE